MLSLEKGGDRGEREREGKRRQNSKYELREIKEDKNRDGKKR